MAQRERDKAKREPARASEAATGISDAVQRLEARAKSLERERDRLKMELESAHERIKSLEAAQADAANRIEWVIDSLHNYPSKSA